MAKTAATGMAHRAFSSTPATPGDGVLAQLFAKARPLVMGVLNVTPDSFSDGGRFLQPAAAVEHARRLAAEGADIIDIGAESTRPYGGAVSVTLEDERERLAAILPTVVALGIPVSIDTHKAGIAAWALKAGAAIVNDVWGLQRDPDMARVVAAQRRSRHYYAQSRGRRSRHRHHRRRHRVLFALA